MDACYRFRINLPKKNALEKTFLGVVKTRPINHYVYTSLTPAFCKLLLALLALELTTRVGTTQRSGKASVSSKCQIVPIGTVREIRKRDYSPYGYLRFPPNLLENRLVGENQCYHRIPGLNFAHKQKKPQVMELSAVSPILARSSHPNRGGGGYFFCPPPSPPPKKWTKKAYVLFSALCTGEIF